MWLEYLAPYVLWLANSMDQNPWLIAQKWLKFGVLRAAERAIVIVRVVHDISATVR